MKQAKSSVWIWVASAVMATALGSVLSFADGSRVAEISWAQQVGAPGDCASYRTTDRIQIESDGKVRKSISVFGIRCASDGERYTRGHQSPTATFQIPSAELPGLLSRVQALGSMAGSSQGSHGASSGGELMVSISGFDVIRSSNRGAYSAWMDIVEAVRSVESN